SVSRAVIAAGSMPSSQRPSPGAPLTADARKAGRRANRPASLSSGDCRSSSSKVAAIVPPRACGLRAFFSLSQEPQPARKVDEGYQGGGDIGEGGSAQHAAGRRHVGLVEIVAF